MRVPPFPRLHIALAFVPLCAGVACNDASQPAKPDNAVEEMSIVVEADKSRILEEEQSLEKKRASVEEDQQRLERERTEINERLASLSKKDKSARDKLESDQKRVQDEENRLASQRRSFDDEREKLERDKSKLLEKISKIDQPKGGQTVQQREEGMARRERDLARRESDLAEREKRVAEREADVSKALRDAQGLLSSIGSTKVIVQNVPAAAPSASPTSTTVASMRRDVMRKMEGRGILVDDLPPAARDLDSQSKTDTKGKDYAGAQDALVKLDKAIDGIAVNGPFVQGKMTRINRTYASTKLDAAKSAQIQKLLSEFSELATDGRWDRANQKANQMVAIYQSR